MKRIILLLVTLLSFSLKADIVWQWQQDIDSYTTIKAFCVYRSPDAVAGSLYLSTVEERYDSPPRVVSFEPFMYQDKAFGCRRKLED